MTNFEKSSPISYVLFWSFLWNRLWIQRDIKWSGFKKSIFCQNKAKAPFFMAWCFSEQILWMLFGECGLEIWRILFGVFGAPNLLLGVLWLLLLWFCPFNNGKMLKHILAAHQYCVPVSLSILAFALFSTYVFLYMFFFVFMYLWYLCILVIQQWWLWEGGVVNT